MGAPKPWPTRWPEPGTLPIDPDYDDEPIEDPDYTIDPDPNETPYRLPEEKITPFAVTWGVTHPCNLRCNHCYDVVGYHRTDLSTAQALEVIDRLALAGCSLIVFSGGEPMLRQDLFQLMEHCRLRGLRVGMRSNATLITESKAQALADLDVCVVGVSLDGANAPSHDAIRGEGAFQRTMAGIRYLHTNGIRVNVEVVLSQRNAHESLQFIPLAEQLGVDELNFSAIAPQGRAEHLQNDMLTHATWQQLTTELYHASQTAKVTVSPSCALTGRCVACIEPNITCEGWVTPCYLSKHKLFHILEVEPAEIMTRLHQNRRATLNICGRNRWLYPEKSLGLNDRVRL